MPRLRRVGVIRAVGDSDNTEHCKDGKAFAARGWKTRDMMEMHRVLRHPNEQIRRGIAKAAGVLLTSEWGSCITCFKAIRHRHSIQKTRDNRATDCGKRFFIDLAEGMRVPGLNGSKYITIQHTTSSICPIYGLSVMLFPLLVKTTI